MHIYISIYRTFSRSYCQEMFSQLSTCWLVSLKNEVENTVQIYKWVSSVWVSTALYIIKLLPNLN